MTRTEREQLVEQYLEGSMDFAQEENFFIQVALDDELRRTLKSYRIVEEAIRKEREAGTREHAAPRYAVAGMLATTPQQPSAATPNTQGKLAGFLKNRISRRIAAAMGATSLVLFGWMGVQQLTDVQDQTADIRQQVSDIKQHQQAFEATQTESAPAAGTTTKADDLLPPVTNTQQAAVDAPEVSRTVEQRETNKPQQALSAHTPTPQTLSTSPLRLDTTQRATSQQEQIKLNTEIEWGTKK